VHVQETKLNTTLVKTTYLYNMETRFPYLLQTWGESLAWEL